MIKPWPIERITTTAAIEDCRGYCEDGGRCCKCKPSCPGCEPDLCPCVQIPRMLDEEDTQE